jgi:hypothetical protein
MEPLTPEEFTPAMNCREAQLQICAERDNASTLRPGPELDVHLAHCDACRRVRDELAAALAGWRAETLNVALPSVDREWHAVRRQIRGGAASGAEFGSRPRRNLFAWIAVPLGAAAAVAVAFFVSPPSPSAQSRASVEHIARVNSVEAPGNDASTMVLVDDKSGWLFVWATDANPKRG